MVYPVNAVRLLKEPPMKSKFALMLTIILLVVLALGIVPVYAQEATVEPTTSAEVQAAEPESHPVAGVAEAEPQTVGSGATTLILLVGLLAVGAVGFGAFVRAGSRQPGA
jgi:hypothetical protein